MTSQLVLSVNLSADGKSLADSFRWYWLGGENTLTAEGDRDALRRAVAERSAGAQSAWLIVPGSQVSTRELEYSEKEKKHLRNLLPFQLEESVVGDVDDLHFALATPADGKVAVAYTEKSWLQAAFAELSALGIEITHCWAAPLVLPLAEVPETRVWSIGLYDDQVQIRYAAKLGFSLAKTQGALAISLLIAAQKCEEDLPNFHLFAANESDLAALVDMIPAAQQEAITEERVLNQSAMDFSNSSIDLCQGDFSQRLPIERWWKLWQSITIFAAVCLAVYLGVLLFDIYTLSKENKKIMQSRDASATAVLTRVRGDVEKQISIMLRDMKPAARLGSVMELLVIALPEVAAVPSASVKGFSYAADPGDLNVNVQADSYAAFETLKNNIEAKGLKAEILGISAQGNQQSGRLKISK